MTNIPQLVFGGASIATDGSFRNVAEVSTLLEALEREGIEEIDTAQIYGASEQLLGEAGVSSRFLVDTKHSGGWSAGSSSREDVYQKGLESLKRLGVDNVNIFYLHAPDPEIPLKETLAGINDLYQAGKFETFGLSNFTPEEVSEVVSVAKDNDFILPKVYQGNYNLVSRNIEVDLFPVLRENGIAFFAYSPIAGGFLTKTRAQLVEGTKGDGRWDPQSSMGSFYHMMYSKPIFFQALDEWNAISESSGIPKAELAYRWIAFHSALDAQLGDGLVIGASSTDQLKRTIVALNNGSLLDSVADQISAIWEIVKKDSITNNFDLVRS
ncbi:alcohol dehydrogenase [Penicillium malachiteum]|uniref:alcohol dehydrogenase n=1 Tax=Penicillium malachiteum TaxID=1324776 RepID=UPI002547DD00|nr:alcohol dehydrogenase [Penicillium malachiteum]KAJ5715269.1 alcohol dehydrogenase [Penicillium malachiteum]